MGDLLHLHKMLYNITAAIYLQITILHYIGNVI